MEASQHEERVKPLELFFDLVFVFGLTQVTTMLSTDPTWGGLLRGILVLGAIWWAWAAYAWLTNTLNPEEGIVRIAMFGVMAAMLVAALAVPEAFDEHGVIFGVAYLIVRAMHLALYALAARGDHDLLGAVLRFIPSSTISGALILTAAFTEGDARIALWVIALAVDYLGALVGRGAGWHLSPGHFAERHGLIVIIAIGESIVALGIGAAGTPLTAGVITAALLGITVAASLWWTYFDWVSIVTEQQLRQATGTQQTELARDAYSYLHFLMVAGIVLFAVGHEEDARRLRRASRRGSRDGSLRRTRAVPPRARAAPAANLWGDRRSSGQLPAQGRTRTPTRDAHAPCVLALRWGCPGTPGGRFRGRRLRWAHRLRGAPVPRVSLADPARRAHHRAAPVALRGGSLTQSRSRTPCVAPRSVRFFASAIASELSVS